LKKILIPVVLVLMPVSFGLWLLLRRGHATAPPEDTPAIFQAEAFGNGTVFRYSDEQTPLRALKWLPPQPDNVQALQVVTQNDRQRVVLFKGRKQIGDYLISRPMGVREGFFNFAELAEAIVLPDIAVLLYRSANPSAGELPLLIAQDLKEGNLRWVHRAPGEHIVLAPDPKDAAIFLYGPTSAVIRLPLALQQSERIGATPFRSNIKAMEMPEEIKSVSDFLPTGPRSFLVAHSGGLSSFAGIGEWKHTPMPTQKPFAFADDRSVLAASKGIWWQPFPGTIFRVKPDGSPADAEASIPEPDDPWAKDRRLLRLKGVDPLGNFWFSLATPVASSPIATPETPQKNESEATETPETPVPTLGEAKLDANPISAETPEWSAYLSQGLERTYLWHPERRTLKRINLTSIWTTLTTPPGMNRPAAFPNFQPASGTVLMESGSAAWSIPLESLIRKGN